MKKLKEVVDKQRDEIRAKDRELGLKNEDVEAVSAELCHVHSWLVGTSKGLRSPLQKLPFSPSVSFHGLHEVGILPWLGGPGPEMVAMGRTLSRVFTGTVGGGNMAMPSDLTIDPY